MSKILQFSSNKQIIVQMITW